MLIMHFLSLATVVVILCCGGVVKSEVQFKGTIPIPQPGILNLFEHYKATDAHKFSILSASYSQSANSFDKAFMLYLPGLSLDSNFTNYFPKVIYNSLRWPKQVQQIPYDQFDLDAVLLPDGCQIVGKTDGNIFIADVTDIDFPVTHSITDAMLPNKGAFNYADAVWVFNPRLGKDNLITCRVRFNGDGSIEAAQLVYFERPALGDEMSKTWSETVLKDSACDSNLVLYHYSERLTDWEVVFATGLYTRRLDILWPETGRGNVGDWDTPDDIKSVILSEGREFYDLQLADINSDGRLDLVVTVQSSTNGTLEVWEIPDNFREPSQYTRHVIQAGFVSRSGDKGRSPGVVKIFYPKKDQSGKPWILLAGGDDGRAYYLQPLSELSHEWIYETITVLDEGVNQSVGGVEAADVDGDGYAEIFVSVHNKNRIQAYSFLNSGI